MESLLSCDLHAAIKDCFAVVNSSTSEGMASAVLEVRQKLIFTFYNLKVALRKVKIGVAPYPAPSK